MRGEQQTKLVLLIVALVAIILLSLPTWISLLVSPPPPPDTSFSWDDGIFVFIADQKATEAETYLGVVDSKDIKGPGSISGWQINIGNGPPVESPTPVAYVVARGRSTKLIRWCGGWGSGRAVLLAPGAYPAELRAMAEEYKGTDEFIAYALYGSLNDCEVNDDQFWSDGPQGQKRFGSPYLAIEPLSKTQPNATSLKTCVNLTAVYPGPAVIAYQSSKSRDDRPQVDGGTETRIAWRSCAPTKPDSFDPGSSYLREAAAAVTDIEDATADSQKTFLGGAAIGLIGALVIEILKSFIDLRFTELPEAEKEVDSTEDHRAPAEPYNPHSRGYL